ncbi:hypothetical protein M514_24087 [Trichuris suis]|uniref:Uncharacterized protein n=1 Tax=Trichuris suis TaxID=68888 RepID=A0A085N2N8_9BILA|nr:hypothetical protein M514_24087 [Trichuris suis]
MVLYTAENGTRGKCAAPALIGQRSPRFTDLDTFVSVKRFIMAGAERLFDFPSGKQALATEDHRSEVERTLGGMFDDSCAFDRVSRSFLVIRFLPLSFGLLAFLLWWPLRWDMLADNDSSCVCETSMLFCVSLSFIRALL